MQTTELTTSSGKADWLLRWSPDAQTKQRLFCFPFAGGGAYYYRTWRQVLPAEIEICAIQLPGRETRRTEQAFTSMKELIPVLAQVVAPLMDVPTYFFGHSMGGMTAFELYRYLRKQNAAAPHHLFISATCAPQLQGTRMPLHNMSDDALLQAMVEYGGTPREVLDDKDMVAMMLPLMRADCTLLETYECIPETPLDCPITVFGSAEDGRATEPELREWEKQTNSSFTMHTFPGGHFFIKDIEQRNRMLKHVIDTMNKSPKRGES